MSNDPELFISTQSHSRDAHIVRFLNDLYYVAAKSGVADVHIEYEEDDVRVRYRVGDSLSECARITHDDAKNIVDKIRMRAKLPLADQRTPQSGRMKLKYVEYAYEESVHEGESFSIDVRLSLQPTIYGQSVVCRILDQRNATRRFCDIHMTDSVRMAINEIIQEPNGLVLVTGPTGSGKTSTLYAIINELNDPSRKIITIEDPVEYRLPGLCQINIEAPAVTFGSALRESLRQDPDIILVGEIRDAETAQIAVQAAMTGHLVLSTLHTNDAISTITRLIDLGIDPFTLGTSLRCVIAQRLVRKLHDQHMQSPADEHERLWMRAHGIEFLDAQFGVPDEGVGEKGFDGRLPVIEALMVDSAVRRVLPKNEKKAILHAARKQPQYESLAQCAARMSSLGMTTLDDARRITSALDVSLVFQRIGERLIDMGKLSHYQLDNALGLQKSLERDKGDKRLIGELLVELNYCSVEDVHEALRQN